MLKNNQIQIYVVDDQPDMGLVIREVLMNEGYKVEVFTSAAEVLVQAKKNQPHILLTDYKMKEIDGLMLLKKMKEDYPAVVTIMMTAFGSVETAIEAMKLGAFHYITKPFKNDELVLLIKRAVEKIKLTQENTILRREVNKNYELKSIVGKSQSMISLFELIKLVAASSAHVLVQGESGSGKELVARALHFSGPRKNRPFIPINCAAIPEALLESELFGHIRGSFTGAVSDKRGLFEEAEGGTLFLDEIGDMGLTLQAKLLRVLQDKQIRSIGSVEYKNIDVRVIAATHRDLRELVQAGQFREDLYYRLNVIPIRVPSLQERKEDIPLLVEYFMNRYAAQNEVSPKQLAPEALDLLLAYDWPGNVRELENVIERAMVLTPGPVIDKLIIVDGARKSHLDAVAALQLDRPSLDKLEERYIKKILREVKYDKDEAAKVLGVSRRTLYRKEKAYGMVDAVDLPLTTDLTNKEVTDASARSTSWTQ